MRRIRHLVFRRPPPLFQSSATHIRKNISSFVRSSGVKLEGKCNGGALVGSKAMASTMTQRGFSSSVTDPTAGMLNPDYEYERLRTNVTTPEDAVNNILYNTPNRTKGPEQRRVICALVNNHPGVLVQVTGVLAARGFNINSLVVATTEVPDLSRMTITLNLKKGSNFSQAIKQLEGLVEVWAVLDYTETATLERELLLIKMAHHPPGDDGSEQSADEKMKRHAHRAAIKSLAEIFKADVIDVGSQDLTIQLCGKSSRIDNFVKLMKPFGIIESSRSGSMTIPRSRITFGDEAEEIQMEYDGVDVTMLPPG